MTARPTVRSAGILLFRQIDEKRSGTGSFEVLIGHMGGPYWAAKERAAWSIPKGLVDAEVDAGDDLSAALREFGEETGHAVPAAQLIDLGIFEQSPKKEIHIWAAQGDLDAVTCESNMFEMEWPPKSGQTQEFPEIDRFEWCTLDVAAERVVTGQRQVLDALSRATCTDTG